MKRIISLLLVTVFCLFLSACGKALEPEQSPQQPHTEVNETEGNEETQQSIELVGPWHLDSKKNDLDAFANSLDLFPGYGEWGAAMEIRSNGQMSWYIGAEGWHGTYNVEDGVIYAQLTSDLEQEMQLWSFRISTENEVAELEMDYQDMTIYWAYGDREDTPAMGME